MSATTTTAREIAERATQQRLLNAYLRESGRIPTETGDGLVRVPLSGERAIVVGLRVRSDCGHHCYDDEVWVERPGVARQRVGHRELVTLLVDEVATLAGGIVGEGGDGRTLAQQIESSTAATARYVETPPRPANASTSHVASPNQAAASPLPADLTRQAEQSLRFGHPFHPTPKSIDGFGEDLPRYAPELGAKFRLHWFAVHTDALLARRVAPGAWAPPDVDRQVPSGYAPLPVHPWQTRYLSRQPRMAELIADGTVLALGELGAVVYPTSSVRTVCDPAFSTSWKLPLHVRITNFVRTNPIEHLRRAADASALLARLQQRWRYERFGVVLETGYRTIDPTLVGDDLAADVAVLFRQNPFTDGRYAPRVVAGLLEERDGGVPAVIEELRRSGGSQPEWLGRYLRVSLLPLLDIFEREGVSFEAHVQNSLLHTEDGWPERFWVRDMEGTSVSVNRCSDVDSDSPLSYSDVEAWLRLRYHAVTNHLGHLIAVLGRHGNGERPLWMVASEILRGDGGELGRELVTTPTLPAKANLLSRFAGRGERPLYVDVPNPLEQVRR